MYVWVNDITFSYDLIGENNFSELELNSDLLACMDLILIAMFSSRLCSRIARNTAGRRRPPRTAARQRAETLPPPPLPGRRRRSPLSRSLLLPYFRILSSSQPFLPLLHPEEGSHLRAGHYYAPQKYK